MNLPNYLKKENKDSKLRKDGLPANLPTISNTEIRWVKYDCKTEHFNRTKKMDLGEAIRDLHYRNLRSLEQGKPKSKQGKS
jgi:hypothetical protein